MTFSFFDSLSRPFDFFESFESLKSINFKELLDNFILAILNVFIKIFKYNPIKSVTLKSGLVYKQIKTKEIDSPFLIKTFCPCCRKPIDINMQFGNSLYDFYKKTTNWILEVWVHFFDLFQNFLKNLEILELPAGEEFERVAEPCRALAETTPRTEKCAFVNVLFGNNPQYFLHSLILAFSIKKTKTKHDVVLLHTPDFPKVYLRVLGKVFDKIYQIDYITCNPNLYANGNAQSRFKYVFTKLHVLGLSQYKKVIMLDSDMIFAQNCDKLFEELEAPAAMKRGPHPPEHGEKINTFDFYADWKSDERLDFKKNLKNPNKDVYKGPSIFQNKTGINAGIILLKPNQLELFYMRQEILDPNHPEQCMAAGPEQDYLSRYYVGEWTHIGSEYNFQLHQLYHHLLSNTTLVTYGSKWIKLTFEDVNIFHFSSENKPPDFVLEKLFFTEEERAENSTTMKDYALYMRNRLVSFKLFAHRDYKITYFSPITRQIVDETEPLALSDMLRDKTMEITDDGLLYRKNRYGQKTFQPLDLGLLERADGITIKAFEMWETLYDEFMAENNDLDLKGVILEACNTAQCFECGYETVNQDWSAGLPKHCVGLVNKVIKSQQNYPEDKCPGCVGKLGEGRSGEGRNLVSVESNYKKSEKFDRQNGNNYNGRKYKQKDRKDKAAVSCESTEAAFDSPAEGEVEEAEEVPPHSNRIDSLFKISSERFTHVLGKFGDGGRETERGKYLYSFTSDFDRGFRICFDMIFVNLPGSKRSGGTGSNFNTIFNVLTIMNSKNKNILNVDVLYSDKSCRNLDLGVSSDEKELYIDKNDINKLEYYKLEIFYVLGRSLRLKISAESLAEQEFYDVKVVEETRGISGGEGLMEEKAEKTDNKEKKETHENLKETKINYHLFASSPMHETAGCVLYNLKIKEFDPKETEHEFKYSKFMKENERDSDEESDEDGTLFEEKTQNMSIV